VKFLLIAGVLIVIGTPAALFFLSSPPAFEAVPTPRVLGPENTLAIQSSSPHGLRSLDVVLQQGTASSRASIEQPANRFLFWRHKAAPAKFDVKLAVKGADGFKSGPAKLTVTAVSNDLRAQAESRTYDVVANLEPLRLTVDGAQHYINQGGSEMVTFTVSGYLPSRGCGSASTNSEASPCRAERDRGSGCASSPSLGTRRLMRLPLCLRGIRGRR